MNEITIMGNIMRMLHHVRQRIEAVTVLYDSSLYSVDYGNKFRKRCDTSHQEVEDLIDQLNNERSEFNSKFKSDALLELMIESVNVDYDDMCNMIKAKKRAYS